jgi:predicted esterase
LKEQDVKIKVSNGFLSGTLIYHKNLAKIKSKNSILIICHGFSDTKESLQYYYYPLALQGYVILVYDARGTGESKKIGKRGNFLKRLEDFEDIIFWVKSNEDYSMFKINCIGFSIGALTILCAGFQNKEIGKIIAISSMSYYKNNLPKFNPITILSYLMKGVKLRLTNEENKKLSPYRKLSSRVMLIHSKNDRVIKFINFKENSRVLESSVKNLIILRKGGHSQKKNECALVGATLKFLNSE